MPEALLLSGVIGVGKTTVAQAVGVLLTAGGHRTAVVDTDALAQFGPPPVAGAGGGERRDFYDRLKCANLAAVWANFAASGAEYAVVAGGIETAELRHRYETALAGCEVRLVGVTAPLETVRRRLRARDSGEKLDRHLATLPDQAGHLAAAAIEDFTVTNDRPPAEVAREIVALAGWAADLS
ncbi:P-loop NTPase family protein [Flindersiella endophytica]